MSSPATPALLPPPPAEYCSGLETHSLGASAFGILGFGEVGVVQPSDSAYYPLGKQGPASPKGKRGVCEPARACVRRGREGGKECVPPATRTTRENVAREVESAGRARTKALLGAAASLSAELPVPWNWDLGPPLPPITPSSLSPDASSPCRGQRPQPWRCALCAGWCGLPGPEPPPSVPSPPPDTLIRQLSLLPYSLCKSQHEQVAADGRRHLGINGAICLFFFFSPSV